MNAYDRRKLRALADDHRPVAYWRPQYSESMVRLRADVAKMAADLGAMIRTWGEAKATAMEAAMRRPYDWAVDGE